MIRERVLKIVLVIVGLLFVATVYPLPQIHLEDALQMMLSIYVTLGVFLLLASRNPSAHRSLIAFTAWSSLAHAAVMTLQSLHASAGRLSCVCDHRGSTDRARAGKGKGGWILSAGRPVPSTAWAG